MDVFHVICNNFSYKVIQNTYFIFVVSECSDPPLEVLCSRGFHTFFTYQKISPVNCICYVELIQGFIVSWLRQKHWHSTCPVTLGHFTLYIWKWGGGKTDLSKNNLDQLCLLFWERVKCTAFDHTAIIHHVNKRWSNLFLSSFQNF